MYNVTCLSQGVVINKTLHRTRRHERVHSANMNEIRRNVGNVSQALPQLASDQLMRSVHQIPPILGDCVAAWGSFNIHHILHRMCRMIAQSCALLLQNEKDIFLAAIFLALKLYVFDVHIILSACELPASG